MTQNNSHLNTEILQEDVQDFINQNLKSDITKLILSSSPFPNIRSQEIANQILAKKKAEKKLPTWFHTQKIYYPAKISIEQTSSEITANYKSKLIKGTTIIDITGGFGVDCFFFAKRAEKVVHCEINVELSEIVAHNYKKIGVKNIQLIPKSGIEYLKEIDQIDSIYIDPSRRNDSKGKVFMMSDCLPNVPENLDFLFSKTDNILIKNSPMLDISLAIDELKHIKDIHIVSVKNEVKELLFVLQKGYQGTICLKTVNIKPNDTEYFEFNIDEGKNLTEFSVPKTYLYEPNASIMKSGGFHIVASRYKIAKLQLHSHLYTSENKVNFPGRIFKINNVFEYNKKQFRKKIDFEQANITTRNFPKNVAQIRKETKLKDGGNTYLFFTTDMNNKHIVIICEKVS